MLYKIEFGKGCPRWSCTEYHLGQRVIYDPGPCPYDGTTCTCCIDCYYFCKNEADRRTEEEYNDEYYKDY